MMVAVLDRARRVLLTGASFLLFFAGGALLAYIILPWIRWRAPNDLEGARRCRRAVGRSWVFFHDFMRAAAIIRHDSRRTRLSLPPAPFVLVANHPTLIDVTALVSAVPDVAIVAKPAMFRSPLVGRLLTACNHIEAGEGPFAGAAAVDAVLHRLEAGTSVLIFPEGTRSPRRGIGRLKLGAFEAAARAGVPLVAALIRCDPPTLMRGDPWYAIPERVADLTIEPLCTLRVEPGGARDAARRLQTLYSTRIAQPAFNQTPPRASPERIIEV